MTKAPKYLLTLLTFASLFVRVHTDGRPLVRCPWCNTLAAIETTTRHPHGRLHCSSCGVKSIADVHGVVSADAIKNALDALRVHDGSRRLQRELLENDLPRMKLQDVRDAAEQVLEAGASALLKISPGGGKTHLSTQVAAQQKLPVAIVVPTHDLARKVRDLALQFGATAKYIVPTLSVLDENGTPACKIVRQASALVGGGQQTRRDVCLGIRTHAVCRHIRGCAAFNREEADEANLLIVTQQLLSLALDHVGDRGMLIIDETPPLTSHETITASSLSATRRLLGAFECGVALAPLLDVLRVGMSSERTTFAAAVNAGADQLAMDPTWLEFLDEVASFMEIEPASSTVACIYSLVAAFLAANEDEATPIICCTALTTARDASTPEYARELGDASRVLKSIVRLVTEQPPSTIRDGRLLIMFDAQTIRRAFNRAGQTILLDATGDADLLNLVTGKQIFAFDAEIEDGAAVTRVVIFTNRLNRRHINVRGAVQWNDGLLGALRAVVQRALATPYRSMAIITFLPVADVLRETWDKGKASPAAPALAAWRAAGGTLSIMHYGLIRGLDHVAACDVIITLGDPWANHDALEDTCIALGVEHAFEQVWRSACKNELEQAHGRLRAPRRSLPALAIHAGAVPPASWGPEAIVEILRLGRPRNSPSAMQAATLRSWRQALGFNLGRAAALLGVSRAALARYEAGTRPVPDNVAAVVEKMGLSPLNGTESILVPGFGDNRAPADSSDHAQGAP